MSRPSPSDLAAWHQRMDERVAEHHARGWDAELVEAPEHTYGCYVRSSPTNIRAAYVAGVLDWYQYPMRGEVIQEEERTNAGHYEVSIANK